MRRTERQRRELVEECRQSGKPIRVWCREKGIPITTYTNWSRAVPREPQAEPPQSVQWVEVTPPVEIPSEGLERTNKSSPGKICLFSGSLEIRVETDFDCALLERVLRVVNRICC